VLLLAPLIPRGLSVAMGISIAENKLIGAHQVDSPNQSERPAESVVDLLILHNISLPPGEYNTGCIDQLFCNCLDKNAHPYFETIADLKVSSHFLINRLGSITQYVPLNMKAWHAGESTFDGRLNCNDFSIGVELEGTDHEPFTDAQYGSLVTLSIALLSEFPDIGLDRIVGHSDVAPERKTDPGPFFQWDRYKQLLEQELASTA